MSKWNIHQIKQTTAEIIFKHMLIVIYISVKITAKVFSFIVICTFLTFFFYYSPIYIFSLFIYLYFVLIIICLYIFPLFFFFYAVFFSFCPPLFSFFFYYLSIFFLLLSLFYSVFHSPSSLSLSPLVCFLMAKSCHLNLNVSLENSEALEPDGCLSVILHESARP